MRRLSLAKLPSVPRVDRIRNGEECHGCCLIGQKMLASWVYNNLPDTSIVRTSVKSNADFIVHSKVSTYRTIF